MNNYYEFYKSEIYRRDEIESFMGMVQSVRSFFVIGAPSMGKTRFIETIIRPDIQDQYLGEDAGKTLFVRVDINRLFAHGEWEFYELMLSSLVLSLLAIDTTDEFRGKFVSYDSELIKAGRSVLDGIRYLGIALEELCQHYKVCFLFDEIDYILRDISKDVLASLRELWDKNKYRLCYVLFLRDLPEKLRAPSENEKFYSMFARLPIVLGPYSLEDSKVILQRIELRRNHALSNEQREWIYFNSGGHPGLILSLFSLVVDNMELASHLENAAWIARQNIVYKECIKIWQSLSEDEKSGLMQYAKNHNITSQMVYRSLQVKGILGHPSGSNEKIFSPVFHSFVSSRENLGDTQKKGNEFTDTS